MISNPVHVCFELLFSQVRRPGACGDEKARLVGTIAGDLTTAG
jgi:hypothetical protein